MKDDLKNLYSRIVNDFKYVFNSLLISCLARPGRKVEGYNVFGYFSKNMGQAEVVRAFANDLIVKGENVSLFDFYVSTHPTNHERSELEFQKYYFKSFKYRKNIFFIDLNVLKRLMRKSYEDALKYDFITLIE